MKYKVFCNHSACARTLEFFIFRDGMDGRRSICKSLDNMKFEEVDETESIDPTFIINGLMAKPFLQAMANTLNEEGITAEGEPILKNELASVKYHLEDMRTLVFKEK